MLVLESRKKVCEPVCVCVCVYLLPAGHPGADGRYQYGSQQDLSRVVDQQRD